MADDADTSVLDVNPRTVGGQEQNLTGPVIPPGGTDSVLPQRNPFLQDAGYDPAKSTEVSHQLAGIEQKKLDKLTWVDQQAEGRLEQDRSRMDHAYRLEAASADDPALRPWNAEQARSSMIRGPLEQFGSIGSIFAMAASAFTRQPMVSALNAGAAAMTAIHQSDEETYKSAYQAWKDNSNLALKRFDMERTLYEDANKLATTDMSLWPQKRLSIAAQFDDQKTILMMQNGMIKEVLEKDSHAVDMADKLRKAQEGFEDFNRKVSIWRDDPRSKGSTMERLELLRDIASAEHPQLRLPSPEQQYISQRTQELVGQGVPQTAAMYQAGQEWKTRPTSSQPTLAGEKAQVIEKAKAEFRAAHDGREPNAEESKEIVDKATQSNASMTISKMDAQEIARRAKEYEADGMDKTAAYDQAKTEVQNKPTLTEEEATYMAKQYMQGDKSVLQNLGRGVQGQANLIYLRKKVVELAKKEDVSPAELATRMTEFSGMMAAQRTLGQRTANVELFNNEAINMMDIAQAKSREVPRTQFPSVNKALLAFEQQKGDPAVRAFGAAINTVVNTYAKAINGGSAGTVSDKDHAREILKAADTPEQFDAVMNILKQELQAARTAPGQVRQELRSLSGGGSTIEQGKVPPPQNVIRYDAQGNRIQ